MVLKSLYYIPTYTHFFTFYVSDSASISSVVNNWVIFSTALVVVSWRNSKKKYLTYLGVKYIYIMDRIKGVRRIQPKAHLVFSMQSNLISQHTCIVLQCKHPLISDRQKKTHRYLMWISLCMQAATSNFDTTSLEFKN